MNTTKISIIVPCYNEEQTIDNFYLAITSLWAERAEQLELLFIDDGSTDTTLEKLRALSSTDSRVRYTAFSRNFGKESAIFCGLKQSTGDAVIVMDADLQHPVSSIPAMLEKHSEGYDIVEGIKSSRGDESATHGLMARIFYKLMSNMIGFDMSNSSDYKLLDRQVVDVLNSMSESKVFFRALSFWVGFKSTSVEYEVAKRSAGTTKWSTKSLVKYALSNLTSYTFVPLHMISILGAIILILGIVLGIDAVITYFMGKSTSGYPSLVVLIVLATGAIMCSLGVIAVYIAKIFDEVKDRPRYIVKETK